MASFQMSGCGAASGRRIQAGWGSKVKTTAGAADFAGQSAQPLDQARMAAVHAVEIAYRHGAAAKVVGEIV